MFQESYIDSGPYKQKSRNARSSVDELTEHRNNEGISAKVHRAGFGAEGSACGVMRVEDS